MDQRNRIGSLLREVDSVCRQVAPRGATSELGRQSDGTGAWNGVGP